MRFQLKACLVLTGLLATTQVAAKCDGTYDSKTIGWTNADRHIFQSVGQAQNRQGYYCNETKGCTVGELVFFPSNHVASKSINGVDGTNVDLNRQGPGFLHADFVKVSGSEIYLCHSNDKWMQFKVESLSYCSTHSINCADMDRIGQMRDEFYLVYIHTKTVMKLDNVVKLLGMPENYCKCHRDSMGIRSNNNSQETDTPVFDCIGPNGVEHATCSENEVSIADSNAVAASRFCINGKISNCLPTKCKDGFEVSGSLSERKCIRKGSDNGNTARTTGTVTRGSDTSALPAFDCQEANLSAVRAYLVKYTDADAAEIRSLANDIIRYCAAADRKQNEFEQMKSNLEGKIAAYDIQKQREEAEKNAKLQELDEKIKAASARVSELRTTVVAQLSADAKADYQKKRVISNTVAGAALGAGGGFIVNRIVKNKQIEKGYESLQCKIDGTFVGGWGDELGIGYNR